MKIIFPNDLRCLSIPSKKKKVFSASDLLKFISNRFAMLHIFYEQLRSGDITESCL